MTTALRPMHLPKVPRSSGIDPVMQNLLRNTTFTAVSDAITYATTSGGTAFQVPRNTCIVGIGLDTTTAWNGTGMKLQIGDGSTVDLFATYTSVLETINGVNSAVLYNNTTSTRTIVVTITLGGATAGSSKLWVMYRTGSNFRNLSADRNAVP